MDAFESVIASLLHTEGYWTQTSYKVELTKAEKRQIGRPSSPRWELDVIAYSGARNELLVVECKSYLDSRGVKAKAFVGPSENSRYKLFVEATTRKVVLARLVKQLVAAGFCSDAPEVTMCLAAGKIATDPDREQLRTLFGKRGWKLFDEAWIRERLTASADGSYENAEAAVVAKLLLRPSG